MPLNNEIDMGDVSEVSWECIKPVIMQVRGKDAGIKAEAYSKLNEGQKAIFSFHVYYNHAKTDVDSLAYWTHLYLTGRFFGEVKKGAKYFSSSEWLDVLIEVEGVFSTGSEADIPTVFEKFRAAGERHLTIMGTKITTNRDYFFTFGEGNAISTNTG
jgi:hypothetical protein